MSSTNLVKKNLFTKPYLITLDELNQIGQNPNLVGYNPQLNLTSDDSNVVFKYDVASSPKLLNWVEPYKIAGINYTAFYSEVNSGFKIGDKVFIINGTYDSNLLIKVDKYKKGNDGYKVLYIDRCFIVLDILFTGSLPSNENDQPIDDFDDFIKVYVVNDRNDFIHVNRQITTRGGNFDYKFDAHQNSIIFCNDDSIALPIVNDWGENLGLVGSPGFFIKNGTQSWINITSDFMSGSYSIAATNSNDKILILNSSINFSGIEFLENNVYKWQTGSASGWVIEVKHENNNVPIITKSNFRDGTFNGTWNGGLYGTNDKRITWGSTSSFWNNGTLLNTIWEQGIMESKYSQLQSYIAEFDKYGIPYQKSANPDNDGYGYNFVINSEFKNAVINNANVSNSSLGGSSSNSLNIVESYLKGDLTDSLISSSFNNTLINKAYFESCGIYNTNIENAVIKNSRVKNSRLYSVKSINTHFKNSLFKNSNYISDNIIKILNFDRFTYRSEDGSSKTVFKFYINKASYERFKFKDTFYIRGLKVNDNSGDILNFFDKKFKVGPWTEYLDQLDNNNIFSKIGFKYSAFTSTKLENEYQYYINNGNNTITNTNTNGYSLDIFVSQPQLFSNIDIDFSEAYIVNSDFESGVFENSNWNSGEYINYNNDVNITSNTLEGGTYSILLNPDYTLEVNTWSNPNSPEIENDYLENGTVVFLNSVDYDTRGIVSTYSIFTTGTGYVTSTAVDVIGTGNGLSFDITADTIGGVLSLNLNDAGNGFSQPTPTIYNASGGNGTGLQILVTQVGGMVGTFSISNQGQNYLTSDVISIQDSGSPAYFTVSSISNGEVTSVNLNTPGLGYIDGEVVTLNGSNYSSKILIGVTGSLTRLPDAYTLTNTGLGTYKLNEIVVTGSTPILPNLLFGGIFKTQGANNRYNYLHKTKFNKSKLVSGLFRRAYITGSLIKNESYDVSDKDFTNIPNIKKLLISDSLISNTANILSKAIYMNSSFVGGNDIWENGILYNSIWNGLEFNDGLVKKSTWLDGTFNNGLFYNSDNSVGFYDNTNYVYYKSGLTLNNRYSWENGIFNNGEFYKSSWENGTFNDGKFYGSKFYDGVINGGLIGDKSINSGDTTIYNGTINYTIVENAELIAQPYSNNSSNNGNILWNDGIFNGGIFSTLDDSNFATWLNGIFNGGQFNGTAIWFNGTFNAGKFLSTYNYNNLISDNTVDVNYPWLNGIFNGGEFGNGEVGQNSAWFDGQFNGGLFQGKIWNNGIFLYGEFDGSATSSVATGGTTSTDAFILPFTTSDYYGLWKNGYVSDTKDVYIQTELYTDVDRAINTTKILKTALLKNILWLNGTFSHPSATLENSIWLNGTFKNGTFKLSTFNPFTGYYPGGSTFNLSDSCIWYNGNLIDSDFNISEWKSGNFISGTATGMLWRDGIATYMNAYNVFWENGLWKNGNWNGSNFNINLDGSITDTYTKQVLFRGMSWSATASCHIWNIFYNESLSDVNQHDSISGDHMLHWQPSNNQVDNVPAPPDTGSGVYDVDGPVTFTTISWIDGTTTPINKWYSQVITDLSPTYDVGVKAIIPSSYPVSNIQWQHWDGTSWIDDYTITLPNVGTFTLQPDNSTDYYIDKNANNVTKWRLSATKISTSTIVYSNELVFNTLADFIINPASPFVSNGIQSLTGIISIYNPSTVNLNVSSVLDNSNPSTPIYGTGYVSISIPNGGTIVGSSTTNNNQLHSTNGYNISVSYGDSIDTGIHFTSIGDYSFKLKETTTSGYGALGQLT